MKKFIITSALLVASLISCNTSTHLSNEELDRNNEQAINDYLDAWRGSVSEEEAFAKLGITQSY